METNRVSYLNVRETARILGVHENTVRNWAASGVLVSSRVPGSRYLRFERDAVMKLQADRGKGASEISPALRTEGPELVTAKELSQWADQFDAKGAFPDLMRRLLAATPGITNLEVRAYEGVAAHGWDGRATSDGSFALPAGELRFEFGTNQDPKAKASSDYEHRDADDTLTFVAATPRNWPGGASWADARRVERKFADVKAIDAHVLEQWLIETPSVHVWISERIGYNPRGARTIERWWSDFAARTRPVLPAALFIAGRNSQVALLQDALTSAPDDEVTVIQAPWREESLAFLYASLESIPEILQRVVVVDDPEAWQRVVLSRTPLILVPLFEAPAEIAEALQRGHYVVVPASEADVVRGAKLVELPKVGRDAADAILRETFPDLDHRQAMVALARRSMPAMMRRISREPRLLAPEWARDTTVASIVAPLSLVLRWSNVEGDLAALEALTGHSRDAIDRQLRSLLSRADAPFVRSAGSWRLASPTEAGFLLFPMLTSSDIQSWSLMVREVLLEADPYDGMDTVTRLTASFNGTRPRFSEAFKKGVANGVALAASLSDSIKNGGDLQGAVDELVYGLLASASEDETGSTWRRLSPWLPDLAEASPIIFINAIEQDLDRDQPILRTMFQDTSSGGFGTSSSHPSLLWALERLSWSSEHFPLAADLLAKLNSIDPGGRLSNRPLESLLQMSYGWIANSGADSAAKIALVERVLRSDPDTGWSLVIGLWPSAHSVASRPAQPSYRDWAPPQGDVSYAEWDEFVHRLTEIAVGAARLNADRWKEMIPRIDELPPRDRDQVLAQLRTVIHKQTWTPEARYEVWDALRSEAAHHEEFPDATWALPQEQLSTFHELADLLEPRDDARRFASLFTWRAMAQRSETEEPRYAEELDRSREEAITTTIASGGEALTALTREAQFVNPISLSLAQREDAPTSTILGWLSSGETTLVNAAMIYANAKMGEEGFAWLERTLADPNFNEPTGRAILMGAVPFARAFWEQIHTLDSGLEDQYWARIQATLLPNDEWEDGVDVLVQHNRQWKALELLSFMLHQKLLPKVDRVKAVFDTILSRSDAPENPTMDGYYAQQLLQFLEAEVPDDTDLPRYEFTLSPMLQDNEPSAALYRLLGRDPQEFVQMISALYRAEGEPKRSLTAQEQAFGHLAFNVLRNWRTVPGQRDDGTIDGEALLAWVRTARLALSDSGRGPVGDEQIGEVLAASPVGTDGLWPAEEVRDVIDTLGSSRIDTGLNIGRSNRRGFTSRGAFEGGTQERALEEQYRKDADAIATKWPRTARVLRSIADSYRSEARTHDFEAESWSDDG
jgi:excisionase family DNA binding protein